jgi:hypothetical protein
MSTKALALQHQLWLCSISFSSAASVSLKKFQIAKTQAKKCLRLLAHIDNFF